MTTSNEQFSDITIEVTKILTKQEKKDYGIFITPYIIIQKLIDSVNTYVSNNNISIKKILEPSCGTCEIIKYCDNYFKNVQIHGIEFNQIIYDKIKGLQFNNNNNTVRLEFSNFIKYNTTTKYDLIVGNPPYFVCKKEDIPQEYKEYCVGRPNVFGFFILHSLSFLNSGGILAFIIPKSFLNSAYYAPVRNYIKQTCNILEIIDFEEYNKFIDTDQSTIGLIIQKHVVSIEPIECKFSVKINDTFIFTNDSTMLRQLFEGATTIDKMGLKVRTGNIVWNEHKVELTDDSDATLLIYNTNISKDNKLEIKKFKNDTKGQYIKKEGKTEPLLVVNRGNGNSAYKLNYALITQGPYLIENHLNEIYSPKKITHEELLDVYSKIITSFNNPKTQQFIKLFLGNNGLSKTELETIFPIYV
jgi:hypothetical protein